MKALITGITGFVGSHLAEYLLTQPDTEVYGIRRWRSPMDNIKHLGSKIKIFECDIRDLSSMRAAIEKIEPDWIFHLAAQSFVPTSWHAPAESLTTNIIGNLNVFEALRELGLNPRIQIACSSEEYGMVYEDELPIKETNPLRPLSPYGVSKVGQDLLSYQYHMSYKLDVVRTRAFNHTGPRRGDVFVCSDFAKQIVDIEKGLKPPVICVGNMDAIRDFTDVRDIVQAYILALQKGKGGEVYNISTGKGYRISEILDMLLEMSTVLIEIKTDPLRLRPSDVPVLIGDSTKFRLVTGWEPQFSIDQTLKDILEYWRKA
ncbi:MAG: GDP-mannose 4,6-dehydratase [bacterium]|jgi:GDP-4-dehydro-6-deoxy-D-mannose reductase|nr:GDP-mannose 4,6-dehydratase [bacterium]